MCTADRSKQPPSPAGAVGVMEAELTPEDVELDNEMEASAPTTTSGPLVAAVIAAGCTIGASRFSGRFMLLLLSALLLVSCALPSHAHNYIKSQHRAKMASVTVPCPERIGNQPHVQVIKNQDFEIEWSVGHGHNTNVPYYFAIVEEKNLKYLANPNVKTILDQYLKEAPNGALLTGAKWQKNHLFAKKECINDRCKLDNYFLEPTGMPKNDPGYIVREQVYREKATPSIYQDENEVVQVRFKPALLKFDRRAEYANAKWPWLEAVHSFNNTLKEHTFNAVQANIARFRIPARGGAGNYVAWFSWQGYYDCVDVNVQPGTNAIANRYGTVSTNPNPQITKLDHCEYLYINTPMGGCQQVVNGDTTKCIERCKKMDRDICLGVQVTRMTNPAGTLRMTPNIPFTIFVKRDGVQPGNDPQPCGQLSVDGRVTMGCTAKHPTCLASNYGPDDTVCFGVRPMRNLNNQAEGLYRVATSPEDPAWYSTCYFVQEEAGFVNLPAVPYSPPTWNAAGDKCVDCAFQKKVANMGLLRVPDWTKAFVASSGGVCADCDIKNSAQSMADLPLVGKTISTAAAEAPTAADTYQWLSMEDQTQCNCTGWQAMVSWCQSASTFETVDESLCNAATRPADAFPCAEPVCTYNLPEMDASSEPVVLADDVAVGSAAEEEAVQQKADQETAEIIKEEEAEASKNNSPAPAESSSSSPSWMFVGGSMAGTIAVIVGVLLLIVGAVIGALVHCQRQRTVASRDIGAISVEMGAHSTFHNVQ